MGVGETKLTGIPTSTGAGETEGRPTENGVISAVNVPAPETVSVVELELLEPTVSPGVVLQESNVPVGVVTEIV